MKKNTIFLLALATILSGCSGPTVHTSVEPILRSDKVSVATYQGNWETELNRTSLSISAINRTELFFEKNKNTGRGYDITPLIKQNLSKDLATECAVEPAERMLEAFSPFISDSFAEADRYMVIGQGQWIVDSVRDLPLVDMPVQTDENGNTQEFVDWLAVSDFTTVRSSIAGTAEKNLIVLAISDNSFYDCERVSEILYHEAFHMVMLQIDGRSLMGFTEEEKHNMGSWFIEGAADFFAKALADYHEEKPYASTYPRIYDGVLEAHTSMASSSKTYSVGQLAIEFIVANVGVEPVMEVFKQIGNGLDFYEAFEVGIGMSVYDFYKLYESIKDIN